MATVTQLAKFLLNLDPPKNSARLAFYHFLKNFFDLNQELKPSMIEAFYNQALYYQYWQENRKNLGETVLGDLLSFSSHHNLGFKPEEIRHAGDLQVVSIQSMVDREIIIENHLKRITKPNDKIKLIRINNNELLSLVLRGDRSLRAEIYPNSCLIRKGQLSPTGPRVALEYTPQMELSPRSEQLIANDFTSFIRFHIEDLTVTGATLSGYTFNRTDIINGSINQNPQLFYAIKKIERHYIQPQSDPFYYELVALLEKTLQITKLNHPDAEKMAAQALKKGQMALKNAFPNDRLLLLLTRQLEEVLNTRFRSPLDSPASL